jgi:hypothetical protein
MSLVTLFLIRSLEHPCLRRVLSYCHSFANCYGYLDRIIDRVNGSMTGHINGTTDSSHHAVRAQIAKLRARVEELEHKIHHKAKRHLSLTRVHVPISQHHAHTGSIAGTMTSGGSHELTLHSNDSEAMSSGAHAAMALNYAALDGRAYANWATSPYAANMLGILGKTNHLMRNRKTYT